MIRNMGRYTPLLHFLSLLNRCKATEYSLHRLPLPAPTFLVPSSKPLRRHLVSMPEHRTSSESPSSHQNSGRTMPFSAIIGEKLFMPRSPLIWSAPHPPPLPYELQEPLPVAYDHRPRLTTDESCRAKINSSAVDATLVR
jgi:hypothetical protein